MEQMYCLRCKEKKEVDPKLSAKQTTRGVKWMFKAECPTCGTKMSKMTKAPDCVEPVSKDQSPTKDLNKIETTENEEIKKVVTTKERLKQFFNIEKEFKKQNV